MRLVTPVRLKVLVLVGVGAVFLAACSGGKSSSPGINPTASRGTGPGTSAMSSQTLKLGFIGPLSGADAQLGIDIKDGEQLAISQFNPVDSGVQVVLDPFDSWGNRSEATKGAAKLIDDNAVAVIGPTLSSDAEAADPLFERAGIPNVTASATNDTLAQHGWKFFHRALASDDAQGKGDSDYLTKTLGLKTLAVIDDSSAYGIGLANVVRATLDVNRAEEVLDAHITASGADFASVVNEIVASKAAGVFFGGYYDAAGRLLNQLRLAGYKGVFMSDEGSDDPHFIEDAGGTSANGAYLSCACADVANLPGSQAFASAYLAAYGSPPGVYSAEAYDATNFVLAAIKAGDSTPTAINNYLGQNSWAGITKTIKFLPDGDMSGGTTYIYQVKNGHIVQIGTTS